ncbi:unnamed protein product [Symbiodinium natans]|uniref:Uncharacterized protein n=1 Tax=Symbiodinium natans TaxID=878477 RepID=A0A812SGW1_9DINO|nr:unnamed protein product [Symbiodinium natans]
MLRRLISNLEAMEAAQDGQTERQAERQSDRRVQRQAGPPTGERQDSSRSKKPAKPHLRL